MVMEKEIPFYSMCAHHFVPFYGHGHIAYIPNDKIVGLSKLPRLLEFFARRPQVQERLTEQVAAVLEEELKPQGVMVVIEARHLCVEMRGVKKPGAVTVTSAHPRDLPPEGRAGGVPGPPPTSGLIRRVTFLARLGVPLSIRRTS